MTILLQLGLLYVPFLQEVLRTTALPVRDLGVSILLSTIIFAAVGIEKMLARVPRRQP
jgi:P-type Ca2+ transporter type 2C